jgi:polyhydroxyalkanoate synthase
VSAGPEVAAPLDQLLAQASVGAVRRLLPVRSGMRFAASLAGRPRQVAARNAALAAELGRIAVGSSDVAPARGDRRFTDPAWTRSPLLHRMVQAYLAGGAWAEGLVQDASLDWADAERIGFAVSNLVEAASPSNNPLLSPVAWKAAIDTGAANMIVGPRNLLRDLSAPPRVPSMVPPNAYRVGTDLAVTPGSVVLRTPMLEVIQYRPQTEAVREVPLLIIPPTINKYYVLDLAPGRSLIEYLVRQGQQVFVVSWRNPDVRHREWGFDAYAQGLLDAFDTVDKITGVDAAHVVAACSGGLLACLTAAYRAAAGRIDRLASLSLMVTMIDQDKAGLASALIDDKLAARAVAQSARKGYLDGRSLAEVFAWLRPGDLIWNYWVNNYLRGEDPPKFDILYWNADTTRMPAALHRDFIEAALRNKLAHPGGVSVLGTEIDLRKITVDSYVVAGSADHICPWTNCYSSSQLLGGKVRFVLSTNGHIAALVNPPGNPKSSFQVLDDVTPGAEEWQQTAPTVKGSWWPDYAEWLRDRSGAEKPAPTQLGSDEFRPLEDAPGTYILDK